MSFVFESLNKWCYISDISILNPTSFRLPSLHCGMMGFYESWIYSLFSWVFVFAKLHTERNKQTGRLGLVFFFRVSSPPPPLCTGCDTRVLCLIIPCNDRARVPKPATQVCLLIKSPRARSHDVNGRKSSPLIIRDPDFAMQTKKKTFGT